MLFWLSLFFRGLSTIYKSPVLYWLSAVQCSKQFWKRHAPFLATQKIIIIVSTITLLQLMRIILTKVTSRKYKDNLEGKSWGQVHTNICTAQSLHIQNLHMSKYWVGKLKPKFWEVCHAGVQFQWKKNHLQTTIKWEYLNFSCHSTKPTQEAWKTQFWPAGFDFPSMAAALYICPKLVNLSRSGFLHVTFKWHNHMPLAQWEKLIVIVRQKKWALLPVNRLADNAN